MSTIDGMYIGAAGVVIPKLAHAPIPAPYWKLPFAISFAVILLIPHYLAFATPSRDQMIREHFSTYPIPEKLGTILVLAWSIGGPTCLSLAGVLQ